jgi:hypothetical protein
VSGALLRSRLRGGSTFARSVASAAVRVAGSHFVPGQGARPVALFLDSGRLRAAARSATVCELCSTKGAKLSEQPERVDLVALDTNQDGRPDIVVADTDGDGKADLYELDTDNDGEVDLRMVDVDQDGTPDKVA